MSERRKGQRRKGSPDALLTDHQVAAMAGVSPNTVRHWRQSGTLPFVKVGRHPRVWRSVFQELFHRPQSSGPWEPWGENDKMPAAGDIRRK
jgi:excisionase family DNA binding protein